MKTKRIAFLLVSLCMLCSYALGQTVTGEVRDSLNVPLPGVNVVVQGTAVGTITDVGGKFQLTLPAGKNKIRVSFVGYIDQVIDVQAGGEYIVVLKEDNQLLNEVVVTAEFGMKRVARTIGSSVQNVKAAEIAESGRDNFASALQGRVAGMSVTSSGGAPGSSTSVVLRTVTSISGNNQPLYVVDGIPMNNSTYDPTNMASTTYSSRNLDFASRGNDFNPEDIESMTVLKGAAAAALYGSSASNGAIIITTKKGASGRGKVIYSNTFRWDKSYDFPEIQTKYANGAYGTTNWFYITRYGNKYEEGTKFYDNMGSVLQTGFSSKHNISVEGGTDKLTIRGSASFLDQTGIVKTTDFKRKNISLSGKAQITKWMNLESSMQYVQTSNHKVLRGTDGPLYKAMLWPNVDNMSEYLDTDGAHMRYPDYYLDKDLLNPLFGMNKNKLYDESDRFMTSVGLNITPFKDAFILAQAGWDVGAQTFETSTHPYYYNANNGVGEYNQVKLNFSDPTLNILIGYTKDIAKVFSVSGQLGYHQLEEGLSQVAVNGTNYLVTDMQSINNCDPESVSSAQENTTRRVQAISGQLELGYKNLAFITLRGRNDWSSTLPKKNNSYFYPAVEGSFIVTELPFMKTLNKLDYLKIRGSVAQVGKDANPEKILATLIPTQLTGGGYRYDYYSSNINLKPEMTNSYEIGLEGRAFNGRLNFDFTQFWTHCSDQIVDGFRLSYATGYVLNTMNVGSFDTWGWEAHIDGDMIKMQNGLTWNMGFNLSGTKSKVTYLPPDLTEYYNAYTWNSGNIRNGIMRNHPITTITGLAYQRNTAGKVLIDPTTGLPLTNSTWSVLGNREPKLRYGITTNLKYKQLLVSAMFTGRYKATVVNGTKRTMMQYGTSKESVTLRESGPVVFNGVLKDGNENTGNPTTNNISVSYNDYGPSIYTGGDEDWVQNGVNYLHLQEIRITFILPSKWLQKTFISDAKIYAAGNDLFTWTNYSGIDAVGNTISAAAGGTGGEGYDVWSLPSPRGYSIGLSVTFK